MDRKGKTGKTRKRRREKKRKKKEKEEKQETEEQKKRRDEIQKRWKNLKKEGYVKIEKIISLEEEERKDLEERGIKIKGATQEARWPTKKIKAIKEILPSFIRDTREWKSVVRMLGDKRIEEWENGNEGIQCKCCEKDFETARGLICHLAITQKKREEEEENRKLNTEYEEEEEKKESELIRAMFEMDNIEEGKNFCMDRYIQIKKREEREKYGQTIEEMDEEKREEIGCPWDEDEDICDIEKFGERICTFPRKRDIKEASSWCVLCRTR